MATTTPNFGWPVPTSTDLVKNGATAIEALGDAIDASMADLEGGTSGQILSKNSNTDMDFVWITNDVGDITAVTAGTGISGGGTSGAVTVTNSMATAIDAKGDLVPGTGADTFARLAVGANGTVLEADSTQSTGLKYSDAWQTWATSVSNVSLGNGTVLSRYRKIGKMIDFNFTLTFGSTTTLSSSPNFTLPATPSTPSTFNVGLLDAGTAWFSAFAITSSASCFLDLSTASGTYVGTAAFSATAPFTWTTNDRIVVNGSYEVA